MDQAEQLRELVRNKKSDKKLEVPIGGSAKIIAVTSGKGGVGKTSLTVNIAASFIKKGKKVLIIDADLGLSNVEILLGITPSHTLRDMIRNNKEVEEIIINGPYKIDFISGGNGFLELAELSEIELDEISAKFKKLDEIYDIILIDTGAGISKNVISFLMIADEVLTVATPEPTAMTDAYSVMKILNDRKKDAEIGLVINRVRNLDEYRHSSSILTATAKKFLNKDIKNLGYVLEDNYVRDTLFKKVPFVIYYPESKASLCVRNLADKFLENNSQSKESIISKLKIWFTGHGR